jgi:multidrug efflux system membrane fusion protein
LILVLAIGAFYFWSRRNTGAGPNGPSGPGGPASKKGFGAIPVVAAKAFKGSIPVYYTALGQVWPIYTVTVRSRVDGQLMEVHYKEGEIVQKGSPLIEIDSRPYDAVLVQAQGQLIRDQALLDNARIDLARYKTLLAQNAIPEQQLATQQALVMQDEGIVKTDQGLIDTAKLNVVYSHIFAPITGRVGLRLVDPGNIVHAADTTGMLVITQIDPISVIFTLPEDQLPVVIQHPSGARKADHAGQSDRSDHRHAATKGGFRQSQQQAVSEPVCERAPAGAVEAGSHAGPLRRGAAQLARHVRISGEAGLDRDRAHYLDRHRRGG